MADLRLVVFSCVVFIREMLKQVTGNKNKETSAIGNEDTKQSFDAFLPRPFKRVYCVASHDQKNGQDSERTHVKKVHLKSP